MNSKIFPILTLFSLISFLFCSHEYLTDKKYKRLPPVYLSYKDIPSAVTEVRNVDLLFIFDSSAGLKVLTSSCFFLTLYGISENKVLMLGMAEYAQKV